MATEAGKGEHRVYRIVPADAGDQTKLTPGKHYLGIDAVAWFINKQSSWFTDRISSGTLDVKLASGLEKYQAALGTFELKGGSKVAPVFERPMIPDRNFRGGGITLAASLTSIKKDTAVGGMLKSAANASLGIVAGMVQTATLTGPAKLLTAAGEDLIGGVKKVLSETGEKREPFFDFSGLEYTLLPGSVVGPEIYLLLHRGATLAEKDLTVRTSGQLLLPFYKGVILDDGAWLLLRIRRSSEYSGVRDWYDVARALRGKLSALVDDFSSGAISKEDALKKLKPTATGDTLFDEYARLRSIIQNDGVLSELEAGLHIAMLRNAVNAAQKAISENNGPLFKEEIKQSRKSLLKGQSGRGAFSKLLEAQVTALVEYRRSLAGRQKILKSASLPTDGNLITEMSSLANAIKESTSL